MAVNLPGPVAAARLRDLGARIIKIEPPEGDPLARACPTWYAALHEDVVVEPLDLKTPDDLQRLFAILETSDLLVTSSRPSALERLGLSWRVLHARCPRLCHVAIVGQLPPNENEPGHDLTYQAALGLVAPPQMPPTLLADLGGAEEAVSAALAVLLARERGQLPARVFVSLAESARRFARPHEFGLTSPSGVLGGAWPGYNLYETAHGWIAVAALEPHFVKRLAIKLHLESLTCESLAETFRSRTADQWAQWAKAHDLPIIAVQSHEDAQSPKPNVHGQAE